MTLDEAAYRSELPYKSISNYERGVSLPSSFILRIFCRTYNISADYILGIDSAPLPIKRRDDVQETEDFDKPLGNDPYLPE